MKIENWYLNNCLWAFTTYSVLLFRSYQVISQWSFMIDFSSFNFYHQSFPIKFLQKPSAEKCNMLCKMKLTEKKNVFGKIFLILYAFERNICFEHPLNNLICYDLLMSLSRLSFDLRNVKTEVWKSKLEQHDKWKLGEIDQNYLSTHTWYRHKIRWNCTNKCFIIHFLKPTE